MVVTRTLKEIVASTLPKRHELVGWISSGLIVLCAARGGYAAIGDLTRLFDRLAGR